MKSEETWLFIPFFYAFRSFFDRRIEIKRIFAP